MAVIDILFLVDEICKKYEKYDPKKQREFNAFGEDAFGRLYALVEANIDKALYKSEMVSMEKNRAAAVALSAEVRRIKARLMEEVPKLQKLAKMKDEGLDIISEGLDALKSTALDMNEEIDRQVPLMDEIDAKVDKATSDIQRTNVRLKKTITQIRSSQNFCIDIILLCVILGIASYLYNILH